MLKKMRFREQMAEILASWGFHQRGATFDSKEPALKLTLSVGAAEVHVGTLSQENGEYVFQYEAAFRTREDLPALTAFPEKGQVYRSRKLWPFFEVRIPPMDRDDVKAEIAKRHLNRSDTFSILAELGGRTITSPYRFERSEA